jgi:NAD(P)-dependent dehydrogenase (short-subunit alcohol dehydrogenase family)
MLLCYLKVTVTLCNKVTKRYVHDLALQGKEPEDIAKVAVYLASESAWITREKISASGPVSVDYKNNNRHGTEQL